MDQHQSMAALVAALKRSGSSVAGMRHFDAIVPTLMNAVCFVDTQSLASDITVRVHFADMLPTDLVVIIWLGRPGVGTPDIEPVDGSTGGYVDFSVPAAAVGANDGAMVTLLAALVRGEEQWVSAPVEVKIGNGSSALLAFKPFIASMTDSRGLVLDNGVSVDTQMTLRGLAAPGQRVEVFSDTVSRGVALSDSDGRWSYQVSGLTLGRHALTAKALYGSGKTSEARIVNIRAVARFTEGFDSVPVGALVEHNTSNLTVKKLSGQTRSERVYPSPPYTTGTYYNGNRTVPTSVEISFNGLAKNIKIGLQCELEKPIIFTFYNYLHQPVGAASITAKPYPSGSWLTYNHPSGRDIASFTMACAGGFSFDNLTVE